METLKRIAVRPNPQSDPDGRVALIHLIALVAPKESAIDAVFELEKRLGSACDIISAPFDELRSVPSVCDQIAHSLKSVHAIYMAFLRESISKSRLPEATGFILEYCRVSFRGFDSQVCTALYFCGDKICHEGPIVVGTISGVKFYPREIIKCALRYNADSITMVFGSPRSPNELKDRENEDLNSLRRAAEILNVTVREPLFIDI